MGNLFGNDMLVENESTLNVKIMQAGSLLANSVDVCVCLGVCESEGGRQCAFTLTSSSLSSWSVTSLFSDNVTQTSPPSHHLKMYPIMPLCLPSLPFYAGLNIVRILIFKKFVNDSWQVIKTPINANLPRMMCLRESVHMYVFGSFVNNKYMCFHLSECHHVITCLLKDGYAVNRAWARKLIVQVSTER